VATQTIPRDLGLDLRKLPDLTDSATRKRQCCNCLRPTTPTCSVWRTDWFGSRSGWSSRTGRHKASKGDATTGTDRAPARLKNNQRESNGHAELQLAPDGPLGLSHKCIGPTPRAGLPFAASRKMAMTKDACGYINSHHPTNQPPQLRAKGGRRPDRRRHRAAPPQPTS
jgi:hypothetical protein